MDKIWCRGCLLLIVLVVLLSFPTASFSSIVEAPKDIYQERKLLFERMESITMVPWYFLAAVDQYERSIHKSNRSQEKLVAIKIPPSAWAGLLNPDHNDTNPASIALFNGFGKDGDGDGRASVDNETDVIYSFATYLAQYGTTEDDLRIALWEYYKEDKTVRIIYEVAQMYQKFQTLNLTKRVFPIPKGYRYSYASTWGDRRGWGGNRIHEGTDIFAGYGTPVRSVSYGYVEVMGWNKYGGWRVGIRDTNNIYYYYAHLSGFNKEIKVGSIIQPGQVIGYVGSSGYGKPGTSGKFPAHLHFGMYKYNGRSEWAFDPYPYLRQWERRK